jgi:hypothetical protein
MLNNVGDYYIIISTTAIQNNLSAKVGLYDFSLQCTRVTAVVLLPGEILDSTPNTPTYFLSP